MTLLGTPRAAFVFALTVFVTTLIQVLSIPFMAVLDGNLDWGLPLPKPAILVVLVIGCAVQAAALALADKWPRSGVTVTTLTYLALAIGLGVPSWLTGMYLVIALALFLLATRVRALAAALWALGTILATMSTLFLWLTSIDTPADVALSFVLGETARFAAPTAGATALGIWWGAQVRRVTTAEEEASLAKQEHEERVTEAQHAERARIAQELHDVAGQHLAGLITLADAALTISPSQPERAIELVSEVRAEGRFAAASLSGALSDLRASGAEPRESTPDLRLAAVLDEYWRRVGMNTRLSQTGSVEDLPAVVSTTAYRALQEALTNAAKHAPGAPVRVTISTTATTLEVDVLNGPPNSDAEPVPGLDLGWGLAGMRERVELLQGTLTAEPASSGGWRVLLRIPITPIP